MVTSQRYGVEVYQKLRAWEIPESKNNVITGYLRERGFLDDARFAQTFAGSIFRHYKWSRRNICIEHINRNIPEKLILSTMNEITKEDYLKTIRVLILKKKQETTI